MSGEVTTLQLVPPLTGSFDLVEDSHGRGLLDLQRDSYSDERLLNNIVRQDRTALVTLFRRHSGVVRGIALGILRDEGEADDLLQDVFLFLFRKSSVFDPAKGSGKSWILSMAYQMALKRRRYLKYRAFYQSAPLDLENAPARDSRGENPSLLQIDGREVLRKYRSSLSEEQQRILNLHFFEGYDFREIAELTGQPLQTVRSNYYRALKRLRLEMSSGTRNR